MTIAIASLIEIDRGSRQTLAHQIVGCLRSAMLAGKLVIGWRLPPSRELADELGVARNAVVHAYAHLTAEGWLEPRGRSGTFIASPAGGSASHPGLPLVLARMPHTRTVQIASHLDWRIGQACIVALPIAVWRKISREAGRTLPPAGYGEPRGEAALRDEICHWLGKQRGVLAEPQQVVITQGASQALDLISALLIRSGDVCAVENPGYLGAARTFERHGAVVKAVRVDADGMDVEAVFSGSAKPAIVHVTAAHQYPMGVCLSKSRRRRLLSLTQSNQTLIVENEYDHEFVHASPKHTPLFASAPDRVILIGTFAKALSPSLRLGFIVAPRRIADQLADIVSAEKRHVSWPVQRSVGWMLQSGEMERHLRRVRRNSDALREEITARLRDMPTVIMSGEGGGLHVVIRSVDPVREPALIRALKQEGVKIETVNDFEIEPLESKGFILGYGHMRLADLRISLDLLSQAAGRIAAAFE